PKAFLAAQNRFWPSTKAIARLRASVEGGGMSEQKKPRRGRSQDRSLTEQQIRRGVEIDYITGRGAYASAASAIWRRALARPANCAISLFELSSPSRSII